MKWPWLLFSYYGRINRIQYWAGMFVLGVLVAIMLGVTDLIVNAIKLKMAAADGPGDRGMRSMSIPIDPATLAVFAAWISAMALVLYIGLAVQTKRWHDRGKSGWWMLIHFLPAIGSTWGLVECGFIEGTPGPNRFGLPPPPGLGHRQPAAITDSG